MIIMKAATFLTSSTICAAFGGAHEKRQIHLSILSLLIVAIHTATAAPAKLDSLDSTFPIDLQPPILEATVASSTPSSQSNGVGGGTTIDSYGNPIANLQPIETPDGRKVVSTQGLQFEIPNYASGITELKKPADDLLPPFIDKISVSSEEVKDNPKDPFSISLNDGRYNSQSINRRTATTTTTTTTTPVPEIIEKNPFPPTIPPWLNGFDYPDLGPGVPFVYEPNENENPIDKNILPPSRTEDSDETNTLSTAPFLNSQTPQGFTNKFITSSIPSSYSSTSLPSIVTIPLPSTQTNANSKFTRPPIVFVPPQPTTVEGIVLAEKSDDLLKKTSSTFNNNFAAPFDIVAGSTTATPTNVGNHKKIPLSADRESFPPFNNFITGTHSTANKTTFSKSEDGKVITKNIFLNGNLGSASAPASATVKPAGPALIGHAANNQEKISGAATTYGSSSTSYGTKYTGRFGGPPGILSPAGHTAAATVTAARSSNKSAFTATGVTQSSPDHTRNSKEKYTGSFGGPPGVLKPYDN